MRHRVSHLLLLLAAGCAGCGYGGGSSEAPVSGSGYHWQSLYRQDVQTVAVPIFTSTSYDRGIEFNLTKALVNQIEAKTPYKVVPRERADTILEGEVVTVGYGPLSSDPNTAIPQEQLVSLTVNFTWKNLRTGRILVQRRNFEQTATYYPTLGEGRFVGRQQAVEGLALGIVQELQADW